MKFKVFAQFTGIDWDGKSTDGYHGWVSDHEIIVHSNNKKNAKRKIKNWVKTRKGKLLWMNFVTNETWKLDKSYTTRIIK